MVNLLKFQETETSKVYFWGCTHIFHQQPFIWKDRGYASIIEHAQAIQDKINNTCSKNDTLFLLGDGFLNSGPPEVEDFIFKLNPNIVYLWGNHESSMSKIYKKYILDKYKEDISVYPFKINNVTFVGNYLECSINNKYYVLTHFPLRVWNNSKRGWIHLHSHNHGGLKSSLPEAKDGLILDIGVEVFPDCPVSLNKVLDIIKDKKIVSFDSHH